MCKKFSFKSLIGSDTVIPDICHNHRNRWLCKIFWSSVKFSNGYMNETALILHKLCSLTKSVKFCNPNRMWSFTQSVSYYTHRV